MALCASLAAGSFGLGEADDLSSGSPERHQRIGELFNTALDQPAESRAVFLRDACGDDLALLAEVQRLLENNIEADTFLDPILERHGIPCRQLFH